LCSPEGLDTINQMRRAQKRARQAVSVRLHLNAQSQMQPSNINSGKFRTAFVLILVLSVSALFVAVIWPFLQALLMGALLAGLCQPLYRWLVTLFRGRKSLASAITLLILFLLIVGPLSAFIGLVVKQALNVSEHAIPWLQQHFGAANSFNAHNWLAGHFPLLGDFIPSQEEIVTNIGIAAKAAGAFLVSSASAFTAGTAGFILNFFVMIYGMFFFLKDGRQILEKIFYYMPLKHEDELRMLERFVSVTRATVKGTLFIGLIQGGLAGIAFYFAGIDGAAFWGTVMVVLSIIPGIGAALVWVPTSIYLYVIGQPLAALLLAVFCAGVVGTIDNVLRPTLVGKDAEMPDLLILVGTLGGLFLFGAIGFIVGPIVCGLFLTAWDIYGSAFRDILPPVRSLKTDEPLKSSTFVEPTPDVIKGVKPEGPAHRARRRK
jgi:predicted PurR-regulated permease PerM